MVGRSTARPGPLRWPLGRVAVTGDSMLPTWRDGDWLLVRRWGPRRPGAVAVVRLPGRPLGIKRLVRREAGGWWVEGDNPPASTDSRTFGAVPASDVLAVVLFRYWPRRAS